MEEQCMAHLNKPTLLSAIAPGLKLILTLGMLWTGGTLYADQDDIKVFEIKLGDYRFLPHKIQLIAGQPAILRLVNTDNITPHNFSLEDSGGGFDIDVDVLAGETIDVELTPAVAGQYTFYCGNKLLFMKSHREKGMEGTLIVVPK